MVNTQHSSAYINMTEYFSFLTLCLKCMFIAYFGQCFRLNFTRKWTDPHLTVFILDNKAYNNYATISHRLQKQTYINEKKNASERKTA